MTEPAAIQALRLEVKKDKWEQLQNGTYKLQVTVNPADLNDNADNVLLQFIKAGMGDRFMMGVAKIGEDEQPEKPVSKGEVLARDGKVRPARSPATTRAEKARRLCGVKAFQDFIWQTAGYQWDKDCDPYVKTSDIVKSLCNIMTKSDLDKVSDARIKWDALLAKYEQQSGRMAEVHG